MLVSLSDFGLVVSYYHNRAEVNAPVEYAGKMCGLCGDFDGNAANDILSDFSGFQEEIFQGVA